MEAALDQNAVWEYMTYPDNGNHEHCLFTWTTIAAYVDYDRTGYWCGKYGWITEKSYQDFIRDDIYHLREG
jgi:hypothetical protein